MRENTDQHYAGQENNFDDNGIERVVAVFAYRREEEMDQAELFSLVSTAGGRVIAAAEQKIKAPDSRYYVGSGKVEEICNLVAENQGDSVIFDNELTPVQQRNIQEIVGVPVIDRNQLILDIFAANAKTREGQVQVELAQLNYLLPRLAGYRPELSRLGGGIGTRGPGETKLEADRRRIRRRILDLNRALLRIKKQRQTMQKSRDLPLVTLVGYTNAGKSTLLNSLTGADVETADRLFATLDPTIRRCRLPDGRRILLTDTVGFIKNIPHDLIAAFRATLEGVEQADLLLHVVDATQPRFEEQAETVLNVLRDLGVIEKPIVTVFNKSDLYGDLEVLGNLATRYQPAVVVSAAKEENLQELLAVVGKGLGDSMETVSLSIPYEQGKLLEMLHNRALVLKEEYSQEGIVVKVLIAGQLLAELKGHYNFS